MSVSPRLHLSGLNTRKLGSQRMNHGPDSSTTAWSSQVWFLRLVYNRNACDSREAEFNRKPVKVTIQTLRSSAPHPFLTSFLLNLHLVFFLTRHGFCLDGQKQNSTKICQHVKKISLCYKVYKRPLFSPDVNFAFKGQKNGTQRKSMNDKNHETCAKNHRDRRKWS